MQERERMDCVEKLEKREEEVSSSILAAEFYTQVDQTHLRVMSQS